MSELPPTVRWSIELLGLLTLVVIIYLGSTLIMPLLLSVILTLLLLPLFRKLKTLRFADWLAVLTCLLIVGIFFVSIVWFLTGQLNKLFAGFPRLKENILGHLNELSLWIDRKTHFTTPQQISLIKRQSENLIDFTAGFISDWANSAGSVFIYVGLVPVYIFLILIYRDLLKKFLFSLFKPFHHRQVHEALQEIESIVKNYLGGLLIQISYLVILVGGGLWLTGNEHALLIGLIFALLNLIPYLGALIGILIGVLLTLSSTQQIWPVFAMLIVITLAQFLDNNILMPRIVGGKVRLNALASICGVIMGGMIAGVAGMFLSLPLMAILKVILQKTASLKHWAVLLDNEA